MRACILNFFLTEHIYKMRGEIETIWKAQTLRLLEERRKTIKSSGYIQREQIYAEGKPGLNFEKYKNSTILLTPMYVILILLWI